MQFPRIHGAPISYTATRLSNYYVRNVQPSNRIRRTRFHVAFTSPRNPPPPSCLPNEVHNEILRLNLLNNNFSAIKRGALVEDIDARQITIIDRNRGLVESRHSAAARYFTSTRCNHPSTA